MLKVIFFVLGFFAGIPSSYAQLSELTSSQRTKMADVIDRWSVFYKQTNESNQNEINRIFGLHDRYSEDTRDRAYAEKNALKQHNDEVRLLKKMLEANTSGTKDISSCLWFISRSPENHFAVNQIRINALWMTEALADIQMSRVLSSEAPLIKDFLSEPRKSFEVASIFKVAQSKNPDFAKTLVKERPELFKPEVISEILWRTTGNSAEHQIAKGNLDTQVPRIAPYARTLLDAGIDSRDIRQIIADSMLHAGIDLNDRLGDFKRLLKLENPQYAYNVLEGALVGRGSTNRDAALDVLRAANSVEAKKVLKSALKGGYPTPSKETRSKIKEAIKSNSAPSRLSCGWLIGLMSRLRAE